MLRASIRGAWLPAALCLLLTAAATGLVERAEERAETAKFANDVVDARARIHERMESYMAVLRAGAGMASREEPMTADELRRFVGRLRLHEHYPGTQGIGYSVRFGAMSPAEATGEAHRLGWTGIRVWPDTPRDEVHAIVLIEPLDARNRAALGFDMHTEATRAEAMDRARDTGDVALTGRVSLVQEIEGNKQPGFLLYSPVYAGGAVPPSIEGRRASLVGFVYAPLRAGDMLEGIFGDEVPGVVFDLYDGYATNEGSWLYSSDGRTGSTSDTSIERLSIAGRVWTARFRRAPTPPSASLLGIVVAVLGVVLSAVVFVITRARERARAREVSARASALATQEMLRVKDMFIGILGHDLRTPLNAISLGTTVLLRKHAGDEESLTMLRGIRTSATRMAQMIEQILDLTRVSLGGGIAVVRKRTHLAILVRDVVDEIVRGTPDASIEIDTIGDLDGDWDADRLAQVFSNLVGNAVRHRGDQPVRVTVDGTAPDRVIAAVHNAGVIPPALLPVVFEPFRGEARAGGASAGLGLGLTITRAIVRAHGGSIDVTSTAGTGTTFTVVLPRSLASEERAVTTRIVTA